MDSKFIADKCRRATDVEVRKWIGGRMGWTDGLRRTMLGAVREECTYKKNDTLDEFGTGVGSKNSGRHNADGMRVGAGDGSIMATL